MRTLFFDLKNGIAGDMVVAALLNMGVMPFEEFKKNLETLSVACEFSLDYIDAEKFGIIGGDFFVIENRESLCISADGLRAPRSLKSCTSVHVPAGNFPPATRLRRAHSFTKFCASKENKYKNAGMSVCENEIYAKSTNEHTHEHRNEHVHEHGHTHEYKEHGRNLNDIFKIIRLSKISANAKELAKEIFNNLADSEAKAHNKKISEIHFHEVGAIDSIVDIVGFSVLFTKLNPDMVICSDINLGSGTVKCEHGVLNVPVPAVLNLVKDFPVFGDVKFELTTPTGAAIIKTIVKKFDNKFKGKFKDKGTGFGKRDIIVRPNALEIFLLEENIESDIVEINTNIDNTASEDLGFCAKLLLKSGALDVCFSPIFMKKFRPGYKLEVLCKLSDLDKLAEIIFENTGTIGIRYSVKHRIILERTEGQKDTKFGKIKTKIVHLNNSDEETLEYDCLEEICDKNNLSIKEVRKL